MFSTSISKLFTAASPTFAALTIRTSSSNLPLLSWSTPICRLLSVAPISSGACRRQQDSSAIGNTSRSLTAVQAIPSFTPIRAFTSSSSTQHPRIVRLSSIGSSSLLSSSCASSVVCSPISSIFSSPFTSSFYRSFASRRDDKNSTNFFQQILNSPFFLTFRPVIYFALGVAALSFLLYFLSYIFYYGLFVLVALYIGLRVYFAYKLRKGPHSSSKEISTLMSEFSDSVQAKGGPTSIKEVFVEGFKLFGRWFMKRYIASEVHGVNLLGHQYRALVEHRSRERLSSYPQLSQLFGGSSIINFGNHLVMDFRMLFRPLRERELQYLTQCGVEYFEESAKEDLQTLKKLETRAQKNRFSKNRKRKANDFTTEGFTGKSRDVTEELDEEEDNEIEQWVFQIFSWSTEVSGAGNGRNGVLQCKAVVITLSSDMSDIKEICVKKARQLVKDDFFKDFLMSDPTDPSISTMNEIFVPAPIIRLTSCTLNLSDGKTINLLTEAERKKARNEEMMGGEIQVDIEEYIKQYHPNAKPASTNSSNFSSSNASSSTGFASSSSSSSSSSSTSSSSSSSQQKSGEQTRSGPVIIDAVYEENDQPKHPSGKP